MPERETEKERKLKGDEELDFMPKSPRGVKLSFIKESKKDKLEKLLGIKLKGISISRDEVNIFVDVDDLSISDKEKIQRIVDGE